MTRSGMLDILKGVRVLEIGTYITGPASAMMLADLGADVVKIEAPGTGDPFRAFEGGLYSPHYQSYGRNKRSVELDTRKPEDLARFDALLAGADVFIQNFRPGVAAKLRLDHARLSGINPRLVYCAISGFGASGPYAERPCYDAVAQAIGGFLGLMVNPENRRVTGPAIADALTGIFAAYGIVSALYERERTGRGRLVELSMMEAMAYFNIDAFTHYFSEGEVMGPYSRPRVSQSYVLECSDGRWVALHMSSPAKFWEGLADAMERRDIIEDPRFSDRKGRIENQEALLPILREVFRTRPRAEWMARLEARGVPFAPLYDSSEVEEDPQARHLGLFIDGEHPTLGRFRNVRFPITFDGTRATAFAPPPLLGEHNEEILGAESLGEVGKAAAARRTREDR
ncbi:CaiB/BaiF CoA transferase family protein [Arenibaculum pallidiluteum]|uniref:CaiB/BaiF CoA transferase family protein n=1 Tax=Arenibaculum pallidiluteum TaxID=2812559 RepID=UPI001A962981|nr:CoA transferase [Arenibaculum pallidiluteum]